MVVREKVDSTISIGMLSGHFSTSDNWIVLHESAFPVSVALWKRVHYDSRMDIPRLEIDTFVRSVGVNRGSPHALFLGAGASMSSGVPSAGACIWQWKKSIFCTNNPGLEEQVGELSLPAVQDRIDRWLRVNGFDPADGQDEYSYFIEECLPIADDRRRFFEPWVRKARPHVGYRHLCLLAKAELFRNIWTTNFDGLVARAAAEFDLTPVEVGFDCKERVFRQAIRRKLRPRHPGKRNPGPFEDGLEFRRPLRKTPSHGPVVKTHCTNRLAA